MSKDWEEQFHQEIEAGNQEEKQAAWEKLKIRLGLEDLGDLPSQGSVSARKKRVLPWKRIAGICASAAAVVVVSVCAGVHFLQPAETGERFCTQEDYYFQAAEMSLQEYAQSIEKDLLYFDWYSVTEYYDAVVYYLKDGEEVICYREDFLSPNVFATVRLHVTDNKTKLDTLTSYEEFCAQEGIISETAILLGHSGAKSKAYWEYEGYRYYLEVSNVPDENYIVGLIEELLAE